MIRPMRIAHVITRLIVGGAQENTVLSCEGLHARGHDVTLISGPTTGPEGSIVDRARNGGYAFVEIPYLVRQISPTGDLHAYLAIKRWCHSVRPDVVHTHSSKAGVVGRLAAHAAGVPIIVHTIHGMSFNRTQNHLVQSAYAAAERYCAKRCHAIVSVADAMTAQSLAAGIGRPEQYETIRSGMTVADFDPNRVSGVALRQAWGIQPNHVLVGTVARLFENKGYEQLIEVMSAAAPRSESLRFVWIGDGAHRPLYEEELRRRGLLDRVVLTGLLRPAAIPEALAAIDILAHTSQWEGLPRAVVQALLMKKPVVSFNIDGAPEVVIPGWTGMLAPFNDTVSFSEALLKLAADSSLRAKYGESGRRACEIEFDAGTMVSRLEGLYRRLAERNAANRD